MLPAMGGAAALLVALLAIAAEPLNNADVVKMVQANVPRDVIIQKIADCEQHFGLFPEDLAALARAGVPDEVIRAMAAKQAGRVPVPGTAIPSKAGALLMTPVASTSAAPLERPTEVGIYVAKNGAWVELLPEIVNFKTGGVVKHVGTLGVVKGDINGHLNKRHSPNRVTALPIHVLVHTPEGIAITEYQLLRLHEQGNSREFRTVTGGVFHVSGGATRDLMPFDGQKTGSRTYEIILSNLERAEYGFLPPPSSDPTAATGRIGKIYSFGLVE